MARSEHYSRSVLGASDEVHDIYCEPCHQAGHEAIAEGYCVDCPEYLCGPCYRIHRRHKALANHVLLDKDSMPIATHSSERVVDICEEKCPIHQNKVIELFCETCDKLACTICIATDHRQCDDVKHIPDIVKDLEYDEEFKKLNYDIKSRANDLSEHYKKLQAKVTSNREMETLGKKELKRQRAEVNRFFDQLEKKMDEQITAIKQRNQATLKAASDMLDHVKTDLDQIKNDIKAKNTGQRCELFIAMKRSQEKMTTFQDQFYLIQSELRIQHYTLLPSEQIQAMMRTTTEICRIATAIFESDIDIKTSTDYKKPSIWGLALMHGHFCVALDGSNKSIKMTDTKRKCVTSELNIQAEDIWSVASISDDQVAVSVSLLTGRNQIQFFNVSASGVIQKTKQLYDVDRLYSGMVYCAGNIYGVHFNRIDKLSMRGIIKRTILTDDTDKMEKIAASPDGQTLYVTDKKKDSVTSMTLDGKIKAVYKGRDLKKPYGITVDKYGYVYVNSCDTNNIQQFTANLNNVQVLTDVSVGNMTYSSIENKLYISVGKLIGLYSLE